MRVRALYYTDPDSGESITSVEYIEGGGRVVPLFFILSCRQILGNLMVSQLQLDTALAISEPGGNDLGRRS